PRRCNTVRTLRQCSRCVAVAGVVRAGARNCLQGREMNRLREFLGADASGWQLAGRVLAFAFPVTALVVPTAASTVFAIFFLAGLWLLIRGRAGKPDPLLTWILVAFAAYFAVGALSFFLGEQTRLGEKLLGRDLRFLGAVVVAFALLRLQMPAGPVRNAIAF